MTEKEAIEVLNGNVNDINAVVIARAVAIKALEKQIPKRPRFNDRRFRHRGQRIGECTTIEDAYNCPRCNCTVWYTDKAEHCEHCGQALDWGE
jgi:hypothetical protein